MAGKETKIYHSKSILKRGAINPLRNLGRTPEIIPVPIWPPRALRCALMQKGIQKKDFPWGGLELKKSKIDSKCKFPNIKKDKALLIRCLSLSIYSINQSYEVHLSRSS